MSTNDSANIHNLVLVPETVINELVEGIRELRSREYYTNTTSPINLKDWITEKDTQKLLGKKTTTLYNLRRQGKLVSTKNGNTTYYSMESIMKLLDDNKVMKRRKGKS